MKKLKKIISIVLASSMISSIFPVSAEDGDLSVMIYDNTVYSSVLFGYGENPDVTRRQSETNDRLGIYSWMKYEGVTVITDSETFLTSESLGVDCAVESCVDLTYMKKMLATYNDAASESVVLPANAKIYFINTDEIMTKEEAGDYCRELLENDGVLAAAVTVGEYVDDQNINFTYSSEKSDETTSYYEMRISISYNGENKIEENSELSEYLKSIGYEDNSFAEDEKGYYISIPVYTYNKVTGEYTDGICGNIGIGDIWEICDRLEEFEEIKSAGYSFFLTEEIKTPIVHFDVSYLDDVEESVATTPVTTAPQITTTTTTTTTVANAYEMALCQAICEWDSTNVIERYYNGETDKITRKQSDSDNRLGMYSWVKYEGVTVITDGETEITSESFGVDCEVVQCTEQIEINYMWNSCNESASKSFVLPENAKMYFINTDDLMSEEEAGDYCKELVENGDVLAAAVVYGEYVDDENLSSCTYVPEKSDETTKYYELQIGIDYSGENKIEENSDLSEYLKSIGCEGDSFVETQIENRYIVPIPAYTYDKATGEYTYGVYGSISISEYWGICDRLEEFEGIEKAGYCCFYTEGLRMPIPSFGVSYLADIKEPVVTNPVTTAPQTTTTTTTTTTVATTTTAPVTTIIQTTTTVPVTTTMQTTTAPVTTTVPVTSKPISVRGDVSGNGEIDLYDAVEIAKYLINKSGFSDDEMLMADVNNDSVVDLYDAIAIAKLLMNE